MAGDYGFTAFKLFPYSTDDDRLPWQEAIRLVAERVAAVRAAVGDAAEIGVDFHAKLEVPVKAAEMARAIEPFRPMFIEEPIRPGSHTVMAEARRAMNLPVATGESPLWQARVPGADRGAGRRPVAAGHPALRRHDRDPQDRGAGRGAHAVAGAAQPVRRAVERGHGAFSARPRPISSSWNRRRRSVRGRKQRRCAKASPTAASRSRTAMSNCRRVRAGA